MSESLATAKEAEPSSAVITLESLGASAALSPSAAAENSNVSPAWGAVPLTVLTRLSWNSPEACLYTLLKRAAWESCVAVEYVTAQGASVPSPLSAPTVTVAVTSPAMVQPTVASVVS